MASAFAVGIQLLESGVLSSIANASPALRVDALAVCDDAIAAGKALTNLGTSTKKLLLDAGPLINELKKDMAP